MGVKSTQTISRADADRRYVQNYLTIKAQERREKMEPRLRETGFIGTPYIRGNDDLEDLPEEVIAAIYHHVDAKIREADWRAKARVKAARMTDSEMEDALEEINDRAHGGEGFENYIITETPERDA